MGLITDEDFNIIKQEKGIEFAIRVANSMRVNHIQEQSRIESKKREIEEEVYFEKYREKLRNE